MLVVDFPTGMQTKSADWEAPFEIREREVDPFTNRNGIKGDELERQAMQNFVNISDVYKRQVFIFGSPEP